MTDSNLDLIPAFERERKRKRLRSPLEYERTREKVKEQVEGLTEDKEKREKLSDLLMYTEIHEEKIKDELKAFEAETVMEEQMSDDDKQWNSIAQAFYGGDYDLKLDAHDSDHPRLMLDFDLPEGNIREIIPMKMSLQQAIASHGLQGKNPDNIFEGAVCPKCEKGILNEIEIEGQKVLRCTECGFTSRLSSGAL